MKHLGIRGAFIAGGAILSKVTKSEIADYDIYPKTIEDAKEIILGFLEESSTYFVVNVTERAITFKSNEMLKNSKLRPVIQIMLYDTFETAEKIFENFDFTVCMGAYDCDTDEFIYHKDFYPDIASRTLRFNTKTLYPLNSLLRVGKYREKGYFMSKPELVKLALTIGQAKQPTSWEELENQIGGSYGRVLSLQADDIPFSIESAIELLSEMVFDFDEYEQEVAYDYTDFDEIDVRGLFGEVFYKVEAAEYGHLLVDEEGKIIRHRTSRDTMSTFYKEKKSKTYEGEWIYGYKEFSPTDDPNVLKPGRYSSTTFRYKLDEEAVCDKKPYLYVASSLSSLSHHMTTLKKRYLVKFRPSDLMNVNSNEFTVRALTIVEELKGE